MRPSPESDRRPKRPRLDDGAREGEAKKPDLIDADGTCYWRTCCKTRFGKCKCTCPVYEATDASDDETSDDETL